MSMRRCQGCGAALPADAHWRQKWCSDRCRKAQYGLDPCVGCGAPTSSGPANGRRAEPRCSSCTVERLRIWTRETIVAAIREWASLYGEPPAGGDWGPTIARRMNDEERARRFEASGRWPWFTTVVEYFGTWNAAVEAAGFKARQSDGGGENARRQRSRRAKAAA